MPLKFSEYKYEPIDMPKVKTEFEKLIQEFQTAKTAKAALAKVAEINEFRKGVSTMFALANVRFTINTNDKYYAAENDANDQKSPEYTALVNQYYQALVTSPYKDHLVKKFGPLLFDSIAISLKTFDPKIVEDMKVENKLCSDYTKLIAGAKIKFRGQTYNLKGISKLTQDSDRTTRAAAYRSMSRWLEKHSEQFDHIYDELVKVRDSMAHKLGYANFIELGYYRLGRTDYTAVEVEGYRAQIYQSVVPYSKKLFHRQAKRLKLKGMKVYDYNLEFLSGNPTPKGDKDYLVNEAVKMYDEMSPQTSEFFHFMVDSELLDLETKPNKMSGGYMTTLDTYKAPFIFANFNGTSGDVDVLTHEVGHAFMGYRCRDVALIEYTQPTLEACEIHSMSMEFFAYPWMDKFFKEDTVKYKFSHLESTVTFLPYGAAIDEFQHFVYANPAVTPAERRAQWRLIEKKYLPHLKYPTKFMDSGARWFLQGHVFQSPFYYIDYTLAQVCAFQFFNLMNSDRDLAWDKYLQLCDLGGSKSFTGLLKATKLINPFKKNSIKKILKPIKTYLDSIDDSQL